jgi:hypothetical protein
MTQPESAYEIWLALGNTGSREDFLNSLKGADGQDSVLPGPAGAAATIEIGEVVTGEAGTSAAVQNVGTDTAARLNFTIPRGEKGLVGDLNIPGPLEAETITCDIEDLQYTLNNMPKFLNKNVTIQVNQGTINADIMVENFCGYGELQIIGNTQMANTHNLTSMGISKCSNTQGIVIQGFNFTAINETPIKLWSNRTYISFRYNQMITGDKTTNGNWGIACFNSNIILIENCIISNKHIGVISNYGSYLLIGEISGSNNNMCFVAGGSIMSKIANNSISGNVLNVINLGGILINQSGISLGS